MATAQQIASPGVWITDDVGVEIVDGLASRVMLGLLPDGSYGLRVNSGALELFDQYGQTIMSNGAFVGPMIDFIRSGIYNNMFVAGVNGLLPAGTSRDDPAGHTANLPGWTVWQSNAGATATRVGDSTWPGGAYVEFDFAAVGTSSSNNICLTSDLVAVTPAFPLKHDIIRAYNAPAAVTLNNTQSVLWYDGTRAYISTAVLAASSYSNFTQSIADGGSLTPAATPNNARYARLELDLWESGSHSAATNYRLGSTVFSNGLSVSLDVLNNLHVFGTSQFDGGIYVPNAIGVSGFTNSWANVGSPYNSAAYRKDPLGFVHLEGTIKSGTVGAAAFNLPAGYRPAGRLIIAGSSGGITRLDIAANGDVIPYSGSNGFCVLDGVTFYAYQ
jgi:hypothetical protein